MPDPSFHADRKLVRASIEKEAWAIEELALRLKCVPRILSAQNGRRGRPFDEHSLADVVQSVVVIVLESLPSYQGRGAFEGWIYRICVFEFLNSLRRKHRISSQSDNVAGLAEQFESATDPSDVHRFEELYKALDLLDPEEAVLVELKHFDNLTFDQIGVRMAIPLNTAKTRYYRALRRLRKMLERSSLDREQK